LRLSKLTFDGAHVAFDARNGFAGIAGVPLGLGNEPLFELLADVAAGGAGTGCER
jgi:hypothetical protein